MKLKFSDHLTAKTSQSFRLKVYPGGKPEEFLVRHEDKEHGEGSASKYEYEFPDNLVVVARQEFSSSIVDPDYPGDVLIEVHIGSEASDSVAAIAEVEARMMAAEAGIEEDYTEEDGQEPLDFTGLSGFFIIRH